jgi:hypothetical protein
MQLIWLCDGAFRWDVFRNPAAPSSHVETLEIVSWAEYLRQHERTTVVDQEIEARLHTRSRIQSQLSRTLFLHVR